LRLFIDIAENAGDGCVSIREAAERQGISAKYLEQIVSQLAKSGLLRSARGAQGGYALAKPPEQYTAGEILRAIEGDLSPVACLSGANNPCERSQSCQTLRFWTGLNQAIETYVDSVSLRDLIKPTGGRRKADTTYLLD